MIYKKYVIVFDLDETIGHFPQVYRFWELLKIYLNKPNLNIEYLFSIFDIFPDFFRCNILKLFNIIKHKKQKNLCNGVMIFTNNNGPSYWVNSIKNYIHNKINYELFDKVIRAFKINGKQIEMCRTSHNKSHKDFINCTKLPENTEICFIDDVYHNKMAHNNVLYINIKPYYYSVKYSLMCEKFYNKHKELFNKSYLEFEKFVLNQTQYDSYCFYPEKSNMDKNIDYLLTEKLSKEIKAFFPNKNKKTYKNRKTEKTHKTLKKYNL